MPALPKPAMRASRIDAILHHENEVGSVDKVFEYIVDGFEPVEQDAVGRDSMYLAVCTYRLPDMVTVQPQHRR